MRTRFLVALIGVTIVAAAFPSPAHAATDPLPKVDPASSTVQVTVDGVAGPETKSHPCTDTSGTDVCTGGEIGAAFYSGGSPSAYGHRTVDVTVTARSPFGSVIYRYHTKLTWSWGYGVVLNPSYTSWVTDLATTIAWKGNTGPRGNYSYFYTWCCNVSHTGFRFQRSGKSEQCLWLVCLYTYPYIWTRAHGNGTYTFDWGFDS